MKEPGSLAMRAVLLAVGLGTLAVLISMVIVLNGAVFAAPAWLHLAWLVPVLVACDLLAARARMRNRARQSNAVTNVKVVHQLRQLSLKRSAADDHTIGIDVPSFEHGHRPHKIIGPFVLYTA